jgi:hypothetical protein
MATVLETGATIMDLGFSTTREEILSMYAKEGKFVATTKPYKSIQTILFDIVDPYPAAAPVMAHAVASRGQELRFFSYAIGEGVTDKLSGRSFNAPGSWTNQGKASETNGATDMVIEGISCTYRPARFLYEAAQIVVVPQPANASVRSMYLGIGSASSDLVPPLVGDPAALASPPQVGSPFNLEQVFASVISQALSVSFQWDREKTDFIGTLEEIPTGSASSYLRASGEPRTDNRYKIPEGYAWRKAGQPDSTFNAVVRLEESVVIPISLVPLFGSAAPPVLPSKIAVDIIMRLHGLNVRKPSVNG